jgi:D-serine deaminase-like pyridoxal phosphate-dependent protein
MTTDEFVSSRTRLSAFQTPLLTLDASAMAHNVSTMAAWSAERGLLLAPHGKTTMAPRLWRQLLDAGAWALTVATGWQAQVARAARIPRVLLANELIDPVALRWVADELADPEFEVLCWADSTAAVDAMREVLREHPPARPVPVLVELGRDGGRAGARTLEAGLAVARAIEAAPELVLSGVAGWEGALAHDRSVDGLGRVRGLLDDLVAFTAAAHWPDRPIVSAGGSAYFDVVADALAPLQDHATVVLRSGAYQVHDDGHYAALSPLRDSLRAAMHGWARVLSVPESGLAILDGGKRDFPFDEGLPVSAAGPVVRMNDQHSFVATDALGVGQVVRLGLSHPCTAFDKWRCIPVVDDAGGDDPLVVNVVRTHF